MREFLKVTSVLVIAGGIVAGAFSWVTDSSDLTTWIFRIASPIAALLALGLFLKIHFRPDLARDYLRDKCGASYFNRDGFCFAMSVGQRDGFANLIVHFQNQFDQPCEGRIAIRPARGFWLTRAQIEWILLEIACPPGGFGAATIPFAIPLDLQGSRHWFEIGASVHFPKGKGKQLRFGDGVVIRSSAKFENPLGDGLFIAGVATGQIVLSQPAKVELALPSEVAPEMPKPLPRELKVFWQLGDEATAKVVEVS
jgi:hypothetical protein